MKQTSAREHRKFDQTFKREAVLNWLQSGKSATVVGEELGINASLLYAWRIHLKHHDMAAKFIQARVTS